MFKITLIGILVLYTINIAFGAPETNGSTSDELLLRVTAIPSTVIELVNRNKRQTIITHYKYDSPDIKTTDGFLKNLVVLLNNDKRETLKSNRFNPEYTLSLSDDKFRPGIYNINGITITSNDGTFVLNQEIPLNEKLVHVHTTNIKAGNVDEIGHTESYKVAVTDSFSYKFGEKISVKVGFKVQMLASAEVTGELNAEQAWTKTNSYEITAPSQSTSVKANHQKKVTYSVFKRTIVNKGVSRSKIVPNLKINTFFSRLPYDMNAHYQRYMNLTDLIAEIESSKNNNHLFKSNSVISKEGNDLFLNIPFETSSDSSRLEVTFGNNMPL